MQQINSLAAAPGFQNAHQSLFISDLDGTLLNDIKDVAGDVNSLRRMIQSDGVKFSIATGRSLSETTAILEKIQPSLPVALCNGALIYDFKNTKPITVRSIPADVVNNLVQHYQQKQKSTFIAYLDSDLSVKKVVYPKPTASEDIRLFQFLESHGHNLQVIDQLNPQDFEHIIQLSAASQNVNEQDQLNHPQLNSHAYLEVSNGEEYPTLEYVHSKSGKGEAARFIQQQSHAQDIVSFGDNGNDLDMFKVSRLSFAPMNAAPIAQQYASGQIDNNNTGSVIDKVLHLANNEVYL
ncbi:MAG TPA: hypothetical protein DHW71_08205 [Gammaproteobacteria bacterium]|nr:hypothetical protein [Gammaproteobacteria bacterium]HBF08057.1 hypothetical protein [Gammaproteobacteria bacterium]HCK92954.1 hypothetical protein [Gammaproteobacteria bacterium]|tara:strand:- start:313 stop:1194 length:882 start_codon:yes stop_codon:yes gene_type:complete